MRRLLSLIIVLCVLIGLVIYLSFFSSSPVPKYDDSEVVSQLRWANSANPDRDIAAAISKKDTRFIGLYGYATYVPGIDDGDTALVTMHGVRYLEGTSDGLRSPEHSRLNTLARNYATRYNVILVHYLKKQKPVL
jgi:hypothetical protein